MSRKAIITIILFIVNATIHYLEFDADQSRTLSSHSSVTASSKEEEQHTDETVPSISESRPLIPKQVTDAENDTEETRIDIRNNKDYGTGESPQQNVFKCEDTAQLIMSHLSNTDALALGRTSRAMMKSFEKVTKDLVDRMKNVDAIYQILAKDQPCFDHNMLKKRLDEVPVTLSKTISLQFLDKMETDSEFKIIRRFDPKENTNYLAAIVALYAKLPARNPNRYLVFKFNQDGSVDAFKSNVNFDIERMFPLRVPNADNCCARLMHRKKSTFIGDLLLDDGFQTLTACPCDDTYVLYQSQNISGEKRGVRKLGRRYQVAAYLIMPMPFFVTLAVPRTDPHPHAKFAIYNFAILACLIPIIAALAAKYPGCKMTPLILFIFLFVGECLCLGVWMSCYFVAHVL